MSVRKARNDKPFVIITNDTARNNNLSLEAKGLIIVMGSRPDDWVFHKNVLMKECGIGKDKLNRIFKELIKYGHLETYQNRNSGKFGNCDYLFYIDPSFNESHTVPVVQPQTEKPLPVKPLPVDPHLQRKTLTNKDKNKDIKDPCSQNREHENQISDFDGLFYYIKKSWPNNNNMKRAESPFRALIKGRSHTESLIMVENLRSDIQARLDANQLGFTNMMLSTYLNGERWKDDIKNQNNESVSEIDAGQQASDDKSKELFIDRYQ